jgi:hypothetical protein
MIFLDRNMHWQDDLTEVMRTEQGPAVTGRDERCPPHVTWKHIWSVNQTQQALQESLFARLPIEVMLQIFRCLSVNDLANISLVCRQFKMTADSDEIWKPKCNSESLSAHLAFTSIESIILSN